MGMVLRTTGRVRERPLEERGACVVTRRKEMATIEGRLIQLFMVYGREVKHRRIHLGVAATR